MIYELGNNIINVKESFNNGLVFAVNWFQNLDKFHHLWYL